MASPIPFEPPGNEDSLPTQFEIHSFGIHLLGNDLLVNCVR